MDRPLITWRQYRLDPETLDLILSRSDELGQLRALACELRCRDQHEAARALENSAAMHVTALDVCCHLLAEVERLSARLDKLEAAAERQERAA
jgi:hypothetical protein